MNFDEFVKDRNNAFIEAVKKDDFAPFKAYCKKYNIPIPRSEKVMKAAVYKATQECTGIPENIKFIAAEKAIKLGFFPTIY